MFETLFTRPTVLARYREGPLLKARELFLKQCERSGYSRSMLQKIAWVRLSIAHRIDIDHGKVTTRDIDLAIDTRMRFKRSPVLEQKSQGSRQLFIHITTDWVRNLGCFEPPRQVERSFAAQIAAFAQYLHEDRRLSPVTISTRCERMAWFFESLPPNKNSLHTISIADLDAFIEAKGNTGWKGYRPPRERDSNSQKAVTAGTRRSYHYSRWLLQKTV